LIYFRTIRWKNFLSTGNAFTEVSLDRSPSTLVLGENGSGKSTILDALTYALFNKPFRNISKPQLINSINGKKLLVEVEFDIGKKHYLVRRGASPNVFQIELDGEVINQDANVRDYQKHLEENVLKLNYKSFTQISVLGSASFTPFMQLHLGARREIIEDILDIQIFTTMNKVLKDKVNALKDKIRVLQNDVDLAKERATMQKKYIETLEADKANKIEKKNLRQKQSRRRIQWGISRLRGKSLLSTEKELSEESENPDPSLSSTTTTKTAQPVNKESHTNLKNE
jgi:DNA repair exonuclease SbcCD ATPase subunit